MRNAILILIMLCSYNSVALAQQDAEKNIDTLFEKLYSKDENTALNAFIELSVSDSEAVLKNIQKAEYGEDKLNYNLPIFALRFLKQLVVYTGYCRQNNISFNKDKKIQQQLLELRNYRKHSDFPKKYKLENDILKNLTLDNIGEIEYWGIIYEEYYPISYSVGRILDIFYTANLDRIVSDENQLKHYLKKSYLFDNLGVIGICNNYLYKFIAPDNRYFKYLENVKTSDKDIQRQIVEAMTISEKDIKSYTVKYENFDTANYTISNIDETLRYFKRNRRKHIADSLFEIISYTSYDQIPKVLKFLDKTKYGKNKLLYRFLERDFGFFLIDNYESKSERKRFLKLYKGKSEWELYSCLLDTAGVDYKKVDGSLDFMKIHSILKFDVVEAFVGGGNYVRDFNTYALIKLLQIHFNTRLGYSNKQCRTRQYYGCDNIDNCISWMDYLEENGYVDKTRKYPLSFHHVLYKYE